LCKRVEIGYKERERGWKDIWGRNGCLIDYQREGGHLCPVSHEVREIEKRGSQKGWPSLGLPKGESSRGERGHEKAKFS